MTMKTMKGPAVAALLCAALTGQAPTLGAEAPDFEFKGALNLEGVTKLSDLRGRLVMLEFFATW